MTDYTNMDPGEFLAACGMDAMKWAEAFEQLVLDRGVTVDRDLMVGWFANAIMHTHDELTGQGPVELPDGSAVFVADVEGGE